KAEEDKGMRDFAARLRDLVATDLATHGKVLRLKELAAREGVVVRTLSRRLAETGVKFQEIVDQERKRFVDRLIADKSVSLTDVARMSGYSNMSSFGRAFQQWHGQSPGAFRAALKQPLNN
ncbi:MAG: helix-turn-helix transcriptional regulator, partial [Thermomicrobiales bacterium]